MSEDNTQSNNQSSANTEDDGGGRENEESINFVNLALIGLGISVAPKGEKIGLLSSGTNIGSPFSLTNVSFPLFGFQSASFMPKCIQQMAGKFADFHSGTPQSQLVNAANVPMLKAQQHKPKTAKGATTTVAEVKTASVKHSSSNGGNSSASGSGTASSSGAPPTPFSTPRAAAADPMSAGGDRTAFSRFPYIPKLKVESAEKVSREKLGALIPDHTPHVSGERYLGR